MLHAEKHTDERINLLLDLVCFNVYVTLASFWTLPRVKKGKKIIAQWKTRFTWRNRLNERVVTLVSKNDVTGFLVYIRGACLKILSVMAMLNVHVTSIPGKYHHNYELIDAHLPRHNWSVPNYLVLVGIVIWDTLWSPF